MSYIPEDYFQIKEIPVCRKCHGMLNNHKRKTALCTRCRYQNRNPLIVPTEQILHTRQLYFLDRICGTLGEEYFYQVIQTFSNDGVVFQAKGKKAGGSTPRLWRMPKGVKGKRCKHFYCFYTTRSFQIPTEWDQACYALNWYFPKYLTLKKAMEERAEFIKNRNEFLDWQDKVIIENERQK